MQTQNLTLTKYVFHRAAFSLFIRIIFTQFIYDILLVTIISILVNTDYFHSMDLQGRVIYITFLTFTFTILKVIISFVIFLSWHSEIYEVKNKEIFHKHGVLTSRHEEYAMEIIEEITYEQPFFGRIFGYATIKIGIRHNERDEIKFKSFDYIPNHLVFIEILENYMMENTSTRANELDIEA